MELDTTSFDEARLDMRKRAGRKHLAAVDALVGRRKDIILACAEYSGNAKDIAKALYLDYSTVNYHLQVIKRFTGKDPRKFYDLIDLLQMIKEG